MTDNTHMNDTIVYVDESGDHSLNPISTRHPILTLVFCIFKISDYIYTISPALDAFKVQYFGHSDIVLHENAIRKDRKDETFLINLTKVIEGAHFHIIAATILKKKFKAQSNPEDPYHLAFQFCMEQLHKWLFENSKQESVHVQCESRGKKENKELKLVFDEGISSQSHRDYKIKFLDKKSNSNGLQIADLIARPIGLSHWKPKQDNRAYKAIKDKLLYSKVFP